MTVTAEPTGQTTFAKGDVVRVKTMFTHAGILGPWIIEKFLQKNFEMRRPDDYTGPNKHKKLRAKPHQIELYSQNTVPAQSAASTAIVTEHKIYSEGELVTVVDPKGKVPPGLYVVTKTNAIGNPGRVGVSKLFGGQGWRVPISFLNRIEESDVHITFRSKTGS